MPALLDLKTHYTLAANNNLNMENPDHRGERILIWLLRLGGTVMLSTIFLWLARRVSVSRYPSAAHLPG